MRRRYRRPIYVTILCWLLMIGNLANLVRLGLLVDTPFMQEILQHSTWPHWAQYTRIFGAFTAAIFCGYFMLRASNVARWIYTSLQAVSVLIGQFGMTKPAAWYFALLPVLVVALLFLPRSNAYFRRTHAGD